MRRHPSTAKPTTSTCHQAMSQSGGDSDSEDSNCIYWDQKGLGTGSDVYLHRFGGGFPGPPLASLSQSLLEAGSRTESGFSFPGTQKGTRRKIPSVIKSYEIVNRVARPPGLGHQAEQRNTPSAGGSRIRKELKPADGAGEYIEEEAAFVGDIVESVRTRRH
ncbi:hypothetical protein THAOC_28457 [Thalassiosira oceanica]|uniref:Uncharacterized protein n=1 Tax=Thalassiosira oceanica TaxID=159749 RepID=K0S096_THAOC|nr:hypothetical protein THAOC_28457 [Thalassiosira oceanica]|eukprot:EJK52287.1 hypothetical protein THAOC_28457 [Thalassiosira oceanica]